MVDFGLACNVKPANHVVRPPGGLLYGLRCRPPPGVSTSTDYYVGPLPVTRCDAHILLFTDRFSCRADMYAVTVAEFTAEGTADILVIYPIVGLAFV